MADREKQSAKIKKLRVRQTMDWKMAGILVVLIMGLVSLVFAFIEQQMDLKKLEVEKAALEAQKRSEEQEIRKLKKLLQETETPEFIERQAREILGMVKPGEIVYIDLNKQE